MGFEKSLQALPGDCDLITQAREDEAIGSLLCDVPLRMRDLANGRRNTYANWPEMERLVNLLVQLVESNPGLEKRNLFLDRRWDVLHFVLSANRRRQPGTEVDAFIDMALTGAEPIAKHVCGTQGVPVRYTNPSDVELIAAALGSVSKRRMKPYNKPEKFEAGRVYKASRQFPEHWQTLCEDLVALRCLYDSAGERGECVIVCMD